MTVHKKIDHNAGKIVFSYGPKQPENRVDLPDMLFIVIRTFESGVLLESNVLRCEDYIVSISFSRNDRQDSELLFELARPLCVVKRQRESC